MSEGNDHYEPLTVENDNDDICPICERMFEEDPAVQCDGACQKWYHLSCAELQQGQFNALKTTSKKKSKLLWLCYTCEQDFLIYKAGKSVQKEMEALREDINRKLNTLTEAINSLQKEKARETVIKNPCHPGLKSPPQKKARAPNPPLFSEMATVQQPKEIEQETQEAATVIDREDERTEHPEIADPIKTTEEESNKGFTEVTYRRRRRNPPIIGTGEDDEEGSALQAGERRAWLYIGRLSSNTTGEKIRTFLNKKGIPQDQLVCEELRTLGTNKAYKVGIPFHHLSDTENPEFWPRGILVRPFRHSRRNPCTQYRGVDLE